MNSTAVVPSARVQAQLSTFGRVDTIEANALPMDFDRVAVNDRRNANHRFSRGWLADNE